MYEPYPGPGVHVLNVATVRRTMVGEVAEVLSFRAERTLADGLPELIAWCRTEGAHDAVEKGLGELPDKGRLK